MHHRRIYADHQVQVGDDCSGIGKVLHAAHEVEQVEAGVPRLLGSGALLQAEKLHSA